MANGLGTGNICFNGECVCGSTGISCDETPSTPVCLLANNGAVAAGTAARKFHAPNIFDLPICIFGGFWDSPQIYAKSRKLMY